MVNKNPVEVSAAHSALENLRLRLLDLTSRNRLISFRHTKRASLRIVDELPDQLAEMLLADKEMRFKAVPEPSEDELIEAGYLGPAEDSDAVVELKPYPDAVAWAKRIGIETSYDVPVASPGRQKAQHADNAIQTLLYPYEMESALRSLMSQAESAIQEMGANILYIALGFLEWFDSPTSTTARTAPLFLIPCRLNKGRLNRTTRMYEYTLQYSGEDIIPNLSLREKLKADFGMALPDLDEETTPESYFDSVTEMLDAGNQPRWQIRRHVSIALLNFSKLLMYQDLDPQRWPSDAHIENHPVVSRFLFGSSADADEGEQEPDLGFGEEHPIDDTEDIHDKYPLIDDADSSQHSALIDAIDGKNLVIEGPPGTGKSQTITNLIAAAVSQGKKVLFVAEKLAALSVVHSRLGRAGLGDFCLELHSHKAQKRKVLDEVAARIAKRGCYRPPHQIAVEIARYEELKETLKRHARKVNSPWGNTGKTIHEILMAATRYRNEIGINPEPLHPASIDGDSFDGSAQQRAKDHVDVFARVHDAVLQDHKGAKDLQDHPWCGVTNTDLQLFDRDRVTAQLNAWGESLAVTKTVRDETLRIIASDTDVVAETMHQLNELANDLQGIPDLHGDEHLDRMPVLKGDVLEKSQGYLRLFEGIQTQFQQLSQRIPAELLEDLTQAEHALSGVQGLRSLTADDTTLAQLAQSLKRFEEIGEQLNDLTATLGDLNTALGGSAEDLLQPSVSGLRETKTLLGLITSLPSALWSQRAERYENDELDELIPKLAAQLSELAGLAGSLEGFFTLDSQLDAARIRSLKTTLEAGGFFKWFRQEWRQARNEVLSLRGAGTKALDDLLPLLGTLADYATLRQAVDNNPAYPRALGDDFQGLRTEIDSVASLREWYRAVRQHYGLGFGRTVAVGDALIALPATTAQAVRSLSDRGIEQQIDAVLNAANETRTLYSGSTLAQDDTALLPGPRGVFSQIAQAVSEGVAACQPLAPQEATTIKGMLTQATQLTTLAGNVKRWNDSQFEQKVFLGRLGLRTGASADNTAGLASLRHTLDLAEHLHSKVDTPAITKHCLQHPEPATFATLKAQGSTLAAAIQAQQDALDAFAETAFLDYEQWMGQSGGRIDALTSRIQRALDTPESLEKWLAFVRARQKMVDLGLAGIAGLVERGDLPASQATSAFWAAAYDALARDILRSDPELSRFSGYTHSALQNQFQAYDNKLKQLQCEQIAWRIDQNDVPYGNVGARVSEHTQLHLLEHEIGKQKRHIPLRQLITRSGAALAALKPCFMMGPMSVAQYLPPGGIAFDMVVMDEASQIKPQDALGAVARGGQLVVVGDPKQLPPTSFFDRAIEDDESDPTSLEESESILDATLPMFPGRRLRWHYRSQHESLIAFSNHSFYDSDLVLFPSPNKKTDSYGLHYARVPHGCFVNRKNLEEAKVIAEAVREHFRLRPDESLGVVAMSADQRQQIESVIESLAKNDTAFQQLLENNAQTEEPLFVKNLENVQGDERDVIFISMTYGPSEPAGRVFQRFGPINSDVGWRRLNVLFTRSRKRMHVFSSMGSDDIVAGKTSSRGVRALHDFLRYCESGILHTVQRETGRDPDSDFEIAVMDALSKEGFECIPQVGVAGFFIDVAVLDPGNPGRYLMGIECDGATYHSAKSTRDRDRLRQAILERLGWRIRRIWSTDWFKNPSGELAPIIQQLHELKTDSPSGAAEGDSEGQGISDIIDHVDALETQMDAYASEEGSLRERLLNFDRGVVQAEFPNTSANRRLLRAGMLDAFVEHLPTSDREYLELIPGYLRQSVDPAELKYLDMVFEIINNSAEAQQPAEG